MSLTKQINIHDGVSERMKEFLQRMTPRRIAETIRGPMEYFWKDRLKQFPRLDGKFKGFPATGFGERAARATKGFASDSGVTLRCDAQGIRQRYYGGEIKPVNARALCFPIATESYGKTPADFGFIKGQKTSPEVRQKLRGLFGFAKSVNQRGNPRVMPTNEEFIEVAHAALERRLK